MFRREVPILDRELVAGLGPGWKDVEAVRLAVAVPLGSDGHPQAGSSKPVHIYFPTEEQTGFSLILNADFQVELDRRRISRTPHAEPYNQWLKGELVDFVAATVVPAVAERFGGVDTLSLLARWGAAAGFGAEISSGIYERLQDVAFLPCRDGIPRTAGQVSLLPWGAPDPEMIHASLRDHPNLLVPEVESRGEVRQLLSKDLGVEELATEVVLKGLEPPPPSSVERYYQMLVRWYKVGGYSFGWHLQWARCVRLKGGDWVRPAEPVFFPQQRDEIEFPADLGIPVADLPEVDDLAELLAKAGVRQAAWRELIPQFLVPRLADASSSSRVREQALAALRRYYDSVRRGDDGDRDIRAALPRVCLPARHATVTDGDSTLRPVEEIYFGSGWLPAAQLETLYGSFGQPEFLGTPAPRDQEQRNADLNFYRWLGVADRPRLVQIREWDFDYRSWRYSESTLRASVCAMGHPSIATIGPRPLTRPSHFPHRV